MGADENKERLEGKIRKRLFFMLKYSKIPVCKKKMNFIFSCHLVLIVGSFEFALFQESHVENWDEASNVHL